MAKRERDIEGPSREAIAAAGGRMLKWVSPGCPGVPDNLVFWRGGVKDLVEFKRPGKDIEPNSRQDRVRRDLAELGSLVLVIASTQETDDYIRQRAR